MRQHFYVASRLTLAAVGEDGGPQFESHQDFLYALLCDNAKIIQKIGEIKQPRLDEVRHQPWQAIFPFHMLQLAIGSRDDELQSAIHFMGKKGKNPWKAESARGTDFYSLLLARDQSALEALIEKWAVKQQGDPILEGFIAEGSTLRAKLCWHRGIPVKIASPLVPMDLMPIQPLDHYDDEYEFLRPGWQPPPRSVIGKVTRWLGRD